MGKKQKTGKTTEMANNPCTADYLDDDFDEGAVTGADTAEFEHEEDVPYTDDDDAEDRIRNLDIGELNAVNDLSREMIFKMNELRNKYLDYIELMSQFSDEIDDDYDRTEMIATLDKIDVYSCLDRADSIIRLIKTIVDTTTQAG